VLAVHHLWAHVLKGSTHGNRDLVLILLQLLGDPKINDPQIVVILWVDEYNIEGFDVEVEDPLAVDELDSSDNLSDEHLALSLSETIVVRGGSCDEVPTSQVFCHKDRVEGPLIEADQLDNKGRLYQGTEHRHLSSNLAFLLLLIFGCCKFTCHCVLHKEHVSKGSRTNLPFNLITLLEFVQFTRLSETF